MPHPSLTSLAGILATVTALLTPLYYENILSIFHPQQLAPLTTNTPTDMAWRCSGRSNAELISNLFSAGLITAPRVRDAMSSVDRAHYCPSSPLAAYEDSPQSIGFNATISAPHMHAAACESLLNYMPESQGAKVLDIGSGSGYLTHVLANIVTGADGKGDGKVVGIDHIQGLVDLARQNMQRSEEGRRLLESGKVELIKGDGRKGYKEGGPYDAIHVGAAAKELHQDLIDQLKSPGRMFIPVEDQDGWGSQWIWVVDKDESGKVTRKKDMGVRYVPLTDAPKS
ncbi:protein-L-isoaspartate O-methyltransferase [Exophiala mesophila]|uniref:Protein-L-isoaspartate O-methyltransferase n=1 Tax=Exophiala mesophila TaxID=212818 RepID=A0A0D1X4G2_EXOME|nr:protein-L-isoaspartate O-methyltransferase [Exophiala mesophila]KIV96665.1 protein-L-isoaspartate O-methyltransferase [Exophiala mesophila]